MNKSIYRISLDIHEAASQLSFSINRGDTTRRLVINLTENGKPYEIGKETYALFTTVKSDGNPICNDCTIQNNTIIYDVTEQTTILAGVLDCSIVLYSTNGDQLTSPRFTMIVYETVHQDINPSSTAEYDALTKELAEVQRKLNSGEFDGVSVTNVATLTSYVSDSSTVTNIRMDLSNGDSKEFKVYAANGKDGEGGSVDASSAFVAGENVTIEDLVRNVSRTYESGQTLCQLTPIGSDYTISKARLSNFVFNVNSGIVRLNDTTIEPTSPEIFYSRLGTIDYPDGSTQQCVVNIHLSRSDPYYLLEFHFDNDFLISSVEGTINFGKLISSKGGGSQVDVQAGFGIDVTKVVDETTQKTTYTVAYNGGTTTFPKEYAAETNFGGRTLRFVRVAEHLNENTYETGAYCVEFNGGDKIVFSVYNGYGLETKWYNSYGGSWTTLETYDDSGSIVYMPVTFFDGSAYWGETYITGFSMANDNAATEFPTTITAEEFANKITATFTIE